MNFIPLIYTKGFKVDKYLRSSDLILAHVDVMMN